MDPLIFVINELRKLNTIVDNHFIKLPQIVAVGAQSAGKSSVIEGIVGWSFLPRGNDIVTRCPLVLNLVNVPEDDQRRQKTGITGDWATLDHINNKNFTDFEEVENEIRNKVPPKTVSSIPIILTIYSHKVVDLSLVDLPGTIKVNLEDKDNTMKQDIKAMVEEYVKNPKSLILAVTPANNDANNSDALHIAKKYDPERIRTICVLTKIDLMDKGTNAYDLLTGKKFPVKLGIIGVRCRSQEEILNKTSVEDCLAQEAEFFQKNYRPIARKNGMPYLRQQLNKLLVNHIAKHLPGLRDEINNMVNEQLIIQAELGAPPSEDPEMTVNEVIRIFAELFNKLLDGYQHDIETDKL
uniref:Dynamin-type G domain-containing protein n=1 Tax=Panagrolaimus davidi TaxID=227884 RepID=A0A914QCV9_9BILA